jgi:hypothetical protein
VASNPQHPITTPQGAVVLTVVLAVASAFGPTLFNLQAAMVFAAMSVCMIVWIYWRDGAASLAAKRWDKALVIPVAAIVLIGIFSAVSIQSARNAPKPITVPSVDDIANRVTLLILPRLQQMMNQMGAPLVGGARSPRQPQALLPRHHEVQRPEINKATTTSPASLEDSQVWARLAEQLKQTQENTKAYGSCLDKLVEVSTKLFGLVVRATKDLNHYASTSDDDKIATDYRSWLSDVNDYLIANVSLPPSRNAFDSAVNPDTRPTFLYIHNSGHQAWGLYNAKQLALNDIDKEFGKYATCPTGAQVPEIKK